LLVCLLAADHTSTQEKIKSSGVSRLTIISLYKWKSLKRPIIDLTGRKQLHESRRR